MRYVATVAEIRAAERASGVPEDVLVERAATAVARRAVSMLGGAYGRRVLVVAGKGTNGVDAVRAGARLRARGASVDVVRPFSGETATRPPYDLVIDGLLGTGARPGPVAWPYGGPVLAVDLPTGVDADTGAVSDGAVRADVTVTFGALKPGLVVGAGADHAGIVEVAPIGLPVGTTDVRILEAADIAGLLGVPDPETDKYRRGVVGIVAGSERYPGAAALACRGAQRAGCGYVRLFSSARVPYAEVVTAPGKVDVWVVGPGLGDETGGLAEALATDAPAVVDADAIGHADLYTNRKATVVTPHTGEFQRLTGVDARADRLGAARAAARDLGVVVLLKGTTTVVAAPDGTAYVNPTGTPWLATAGTGDVLSGVIGALLTRTPDVALAAAAGAWLDGLAGRIAAGDPAAAVTALDVAEALPEAVRIACQP